ncbi:MAG: polyphosphate kinase 2 family protein [Armatimonadetes bacterium]|nr:polyphosphate kinase 2 family protein [Armatimonadota bacterium]
MKFGYRIEPDQKVDLSKIPTKADAGLSHEEGEAKLEDLGRELGELAELMYAASMHSMLVVFQGRDTAGKDGAINRLLSFVNVQGAQVSSFKVPSPKELAHDFLWRVHSETPGKGGIQVFNRSHYEDVLVVRVHKLVPEEVWEKRYDHINAFEKLLTDSNTIVVKFMLHISKDEQEERLLAREQEVDKAWKLAVGDWKERELWDEYAKAYEVALERCSPKNAPWIVIPADKKWFRDLAVAHHLVEALAPYRDQWEKSLQALGEKAKAELAAYRSTPK